MNKLLYNQEWLGVHVLITEDAMREKPKANVNEKENRCVSAPLSTDFSVISVTECRSYSEH